MSSIQEVFIEKDWDDAGAARQQRDQRAIELQAQGLICTCENLYTVEGQRVFVLVATPVVKERSQLSRSNSPRPTRALPKFETK